MIAPHEISPPTPATELGRLFALQRAAFRRERYPDLATRNDRLSRLAALVTENEARLIAAIARDFGHRSALVPRWAEVSISTPNIYHAHGYFTRSGIPERVRH